MIIFLHIKPIYLHIIITFILLFFKFYSESTIYYLYSSDGSFSDVEENKVVVREVSSTAAGSSAAG